MPKRAKELSPLVVGRLKEPGLHAVGGIAGLCLKVTETGARSWVLRTLVAGKRRHMGLGAFPDVPLVQAREKAREAKAAIDRGLDPIEERNKASGRLRHEAEHSRTFIQAAEAYIQAHADSWKNAKHRAQWASTLETYAYPVIGKLSVRDVKKEHILRVLEPIWKDKTETAKRLRGRIESVLDWAAVRGFRTGENPAAWKGNLDHLLAAPSRLQRVQHHRALPVDQAPAFMEALRAKTGLSALVLEFLILCAARSGEARGARWYEFDLDKKVWTVPAERMKAKAEHRVPLSEPAMSILKRQIQFKSPETDLVFPSLRGKELSDMALTKLLRDMKVEAVPHGFRSTFRDWAGEKTNYPRELAEQALAHTLRDKVEAAYRRGDALDKRRDMMAAWARFLLQPLEGRRSMVDLLRPLS